MNQDITGIIKDWPYDPGQISARRIMGDDGREKIQLRLDMGVLQMETDGHPAGERPHGCESNLDYYQNLRDQFFRESGSDEEFSLDEQACELLRSESAMYYHRYLAEFILEDYEGVIRDTMRNLRAMDFCSAYAADESDRLVMEQHRPYVIMMRARAKGLLALRDNRPKTALTAVKKGIAEIRRFYHRFEEAEDLFDGGEISVLRALAREISHKLPIDPVARLRRQLARAVKEERYEEAADLRDRLRGLIGQERHSGR
jgi:hypothetical protein